MSADDEFTVIVTADMNEAARQTAINIVGAAVAAQQDGDQARLYREISEYAGKFLDEYGHEGMSLRFLLGQLDLISADWYDHGADEDDEEGNTDA